MFSHDYLLTCEISTLRTLALNSKTAMKCLEQKGSVLRDFLRGGGLSILKHLYLNDYAEFYS